MERDREHEVVQASQTPLRNMSAPVATTINVLTRKERLFILELLRSDILAQLNEGHVKAFSGFASTRILSISAIVASSARNFNLDKRRNQ